MKVLYIVGSSAFGGAVKHVYDLCSRLDRSRFDLVCMSPPDGPLPEELGAIGVKSWVVDLYKYASPSIWGRVMECMRQEQPDIVHAHGPSAFLFASFSSAFTGHPIVVGTFHSLYLQEKIDRMPLSALGSARTRVFAALERMAARRASQIIFVSEADRQEYCGESGTGFRAVTIPNGIDLSRFKPGAEHDSVRQRLGLGPDEKVVGCVSRLSPEKGVEYLLRAFPLVLVSHPDTRLLLIGDGVQRAELETLAQRLGIEERVVFTGHSNDIPALISAVDLVALPSLWEGQPLAVLEAWAMEKPVVATRVRGTKYLVEDGKSGVLVPSRDPASLGSAISGLLGDPERGLLMGRAGRSVVKGRFDLDEMCRRVGDLYQRLVERRRSLAPS